MTVKSIVILATAVAFIAAPTLGLAQNEKAPGQMIQEKGSVKGEPGASGYAPGHQMQEKGSVKGTTGLQVMHLVVPRRESIPIPMLTLKQTHVATFSATKQSLQRGYSRGSTTQNKFSR